MAKLVKKPKTRFKNYTKAGVVLSVILILDLFVSLFVNCMNDSLTIKIQDMQQEISMLRGENQNLNYEIQSLTNKDRVYEIAKASDMTQVQDNIISIFGE